MSYQHSSLDLKTLLSCALSAADAANKAIMQHYGEMEHELKEDGSPLSKADLAAHGAICKILEEESLAICSEESILSYEKRCLLEAFWLVDPLDGTKDFLVRNGNFTTNIALVYGDEVILGVIGVPVNGELYYAIKGRGAYKKLGDKIFALKGESENKIPIACDSIHHSTEKIQEFINAHQLETRKIGSALKFCALASGAVDIYPRFNGSSEWDSAAGDLIVRESGGMVLSILDKRPLKYNKSDLRNPHFIAFGKNQIGGEIYQKFLTSKDLA